MTDKIEDWSAKGRGADEEETVQHLLLPRSLKNWVPVMAKGGG